MNIIGTQYIPPSKRAGGSSAGDPPAPPAADAHPVPRPASASLSTPAPPAVPAAPAGLPPGLPLAPTSSSTVARPLHLLPTRLEAPAHRRTGTAAPPGGSKRGASTAGAKRKTRGGGRTASTASTPAPAAPPPPPAIIDDSGSDDDDEDKVPVEEHLILRMPANAPETAALRQRVRARDPLDDVKLTFHDDRAGVFTVSGTSMRAKLVDLPCIIEAQKSFDNKQFYKIADVAQMLIVDAVEPTVPENAKAKAVRTAWPDGITPPLRRVRQRRFRQRTVNTSAEQIEAAVENLLRADFMAEQTYCYHVDIDNFGRRTNIVPEDERAPPYPVAATNAAAAAPTPPVEPRATSVPPLPRPSSTVSSSAGTRPRLAPTPPVPHDRMALAGVRGRPGLDLDMDVDDDASLVSAPTAAAAAVAAAAKPPAVSDDWAADLAGLLEKEVDSMDDMDDDMDDDMSSMAAGGSSAIPPPPSRAAKKRPRDEAENGPASSDVDVDEDDMGSLGPSMLDTSLTGLLSTRGMDEEDEDEDDEDDEDEDEDDDVDIDSEMPSRAVAPSSSRPTSTDLRRRTTGATQTGAAGASDVSDSDLDSSDDDDDDDEDLDETGRAASAAASPRVGHDEDDDDDDEELAEKVRLLNEEVATLDQRIHDLQAKLAATANAVLKKRFEEALRQMQSQFEFKQQEIAGLERQRAARTPAGTGGKVGTSRPPLRSPVPPVATVQEVDEEDEDDLRSESIM
ncbi:hypothetical protein GGF31_008976 [Allomyces arbusculus]|nr:hypothetical protein GGF31_008976 [Allomyces arbusculus]